LKDNSPDSTLLKHAEYAFQNGKIVVSYLLDLKLYQLTILLLILLIKGEVRKLVPYVEVSTLLVTGQTQQEADTNNRKMRSLRVSGSMNKSNKLIRNYDWFDLWHEVIDRNL